MELFFCHKDFLIFFCYFFFRTEGGIWIFRDKTHTQDIFFLHIASDALSFLFVDFFLTLFNCSAFFPSIEFTSSFDQGLLLRP